MNGAKCFLGFLLAAASAGANTAIIPAPRDADDGRFGGEAFIKRHEEFLEVARREVLVVIEDVYDTEYRYVDRPLEALDRLDRERVVYVGCLS